MAAKKKGLGRGLDALLGGSAASKPAAQPTSQPSAIAPTVAAASSAAPVSVSDSQNKEPQSALKQLPIDLIRPGIYQPRRDMDPEALEDLANSIRVQGIMQPIVVRPVAGEYEIIAGERRWRACQLAGLDEIPALIKDVPDEATIAMALIENIQREDLNPMEEATALSRLQSEFELTHQEVADAVGKSRTTVTNLLRLMQLHADVRKMLEHGDLEMGHARALLALEGSTQVEVARKVASQGLSVRQTEALVRQTQNPNKKTPKKTEKSKDILRLEQELDEKIGLPVNVQHQSNGKGSISFSYSSLDELDGLLNRLR